VFSVYPWLLDLRGTTEHTEGTEQKPNRTSNWPLPKTEATLLPFFYVPVDQNHYGLLVGGVPLFIIGVSPGGVPLFIIGVSPGGGGA